MEPLPVSFRAERRRQRGRNHFVQAARALAAADDQNRRKIWIKSECARQLAGDSPAAPAPRRNCGRTGVPVVVTLRVFKRAAASGNPTNAPSTKRERKRLARPGMVLDSCRKVFVPEIFAGKNRRRAGESAHGQHGGGPAAVENFPRGKQRFHRSCRRRRNNSRFAARRAGSVKTSMPCADFTACWSTSLGEMSSATSQPRCLSCRGDGESRKEMPARSAAGDGDEGRFGFRSGHVALAAKGLSSASTTGLETFSRTGAWRRDAEQNADAGRAWRAGSSRRS